MFATDTTLLTVLTILKLPAFGLLTDSYRIHSINIKNFCSHSAASVTFSKHERFVRFSSHTKTWIYSSVLRLCVSWAHTHITLHRTMPVWCVVGSPIHSPSPSPPIAGCLSFHLLGQRIAVTEYGVYPILVLYIKTIGILLFVGC